eukprot:4979932-Prymnesium_polylepis.3
MGSAHWSSSGGGGRRSSRGRSEQRTVGGTRWGGRRAACGVRWAARGGRAHGGRRVAICWRTVAMHTSRYFCAPSSFRARPLPIRVQLPKGAPLPYVGAVKDIGSGAARAHLVLAHVDVLAQRLGEA